MNSGPGPRGSGLAGSCDLSGVHHRVLYVPTIDHLLVTDHGTPDLGVFHLHAFAEDAVGDRASDDAAARLDRSVGANDGILERDAVLDVDGLLDLNARRHFRRALAAAVLQQVLVRLEQRVHLAAVVPAAHLADEQLLALVHHVLERVRQIELAALPRRTLEDMLDAVEQRAPVFDVLQPDVRALGDRRARLLDDLRHVALLVRHHDAEALIILDLFGPDDAVRLRRLHDGQIGIEQRIHENDDHRPIYVGTCQVHRARGAVEHFLFDESRRDVVVFANILFHFFLQMPGDDDQLLELPGAAQRVHDVVHHGAAGDIDQRLGHALRQWQEARALDGHRHDDFHGTRP